MAGHWLMITSFPESWVKVLRRVSRRDGGYGGGTYIHTYADIRYGSGVGFISLGNKSTSTSAGMFKAAWASKQITKQTATPVVVAAAAVATEVLCYYFSSPLHPAPADGTNGPGLSSCLVRAAASGCFREPRCAASATLTLE